MCPCAPDSLPALCSEHVYRLACSPTRRGYRRAWGLLWLLGLAAWLWPTSAGAQTPSTPPAQAPRAIWMWEADSYAMLQKPQVAQAHIRFLKAKGVRTLYLYADAFEGHNLLLAQPQLYATLIAQLHAADMQVYALLGSWHLHTQRYVLPAYRSEALAMFQRVLDYNAKASEAARFDGVNLDIEPHILDEWDTQRTALLTQFIDLSHAFMALKRRANATLQVGPAIPFWWDGLTVTWGGVHKPTSEHVQDIYDYVALMDYRDRAEGPDGILSHASDELAYAKKVGKTVWIGIETSPNEIRKVSFDHLREPDMERELGKVQRALAGDTRFGGFVLHHFDSYQKWLQQK